MMNGGDFFKLQAILGHASPQMTMRYAHLAPAAFAEDYGRFGAAASGKPAKVLPLTTGGNALRLASRRPLAALLQVHTVGRAPSSNSWNPWR